MSPAAGSKDGDQVRALPLGCLGLSMELALRSCGATRNRGSCFSPQLLGTGEVWGEPGGL